MTFLRLLFLLAALSVQLALAQEALIRLPSQGTDPHYPYELWLRNDSRVPRTLQLGDVHARLASVTPDLGRVSSARVVFAPQTPQVITLPPESSEVTFLFRLETDAPRGVYALELGLPSGFIRDNPPGFDPVIDYPIAHTPGLRPPTTYGLGQRFLFLGDDADRYSHDGEPLRHRQAYGRLFTLTGYRAETANFRVEGLPREVRLKTPSRLHFPGLAPVLDDPVLTKVRDTYVGRPVWSYGGPRLTCSYNPDTRISFTGPLRKPLQVRRILRVAWPSGLAPAGSAGRDGYNPSSPGDSMVSTPLVVQFEKPTGFVFSSASGSADLDAILTGSPDAELIRRCPPVAKLLIDTWQLPTVLSLNPPLRLPRIQSVGDYLGLTRQQYAWLEGYPSATFGTLPRLLKLKRWKYANTPFPVKVTFDRNGRVIEQDVPRLSTHAPARP